MNVDCVVSPDFHQPPYAADSICLSVLPGFCCWALRPSVKQQGYKHVLMHVCLTLIKVINHEDVFIWFSLSPQCPTLSSRNTLLCACCFLKVFWFAFLLCYKTTYLILKMDRTAAFKALKKITAQFNPPANLWLSHQNKTWLIFLLSLTEKSSFYHFFFKMQANESLWQFLNAHFMIIKKDGNFW